MVTMYEKIVVDETTDLTPEFYNHIQTQHESMRGIKNVLINGGFDIWQRGNLFNSSTTIYTADRWRKSSTVQVERKLFSEYTLGISPVYYLERLVTDINANAWIQQRVEGVRTLSNGDIVVSFYARADVAKRYSVWIEQIFGSGGSPTVTLQNKIIVGTTWARHEVVFSLPSVAGKNIIGNENFLNVTIGQDTADGEITLGDRLDITAIQLEKGKVVTPFEHRPIGLELSLCQRYFCKTYNLDITPGTSSSASQIDWSTRNSFTTSRYLWNYPEPMRITPTVKIYTPGGIPNMIRNVNSGVDIPATTNVGEINSAIHPSDSNDISDNQRLLAHATADAEF